LIHRGHGPLQNILDHYTLAHVNHFLRELDRNRLTDRIDRIYEFRVSQLTQDGYLGEMRRLRQAVRMFDSRSGTAQSQGRKFMTPDEQRKWDTETSHLSFNLLPKAEQERITAERESLWAQIPSHIQAKSRKLAGR